MKPLRLCLLLKYPPTEGGVSQQGYWLAHNLARAGHQVHVVSNGGEVEAPYRMFIPEAERPRLEGHYPGGGFVRLHSTCEPEQSAGYIPYANPFVSKLAALAYEVVRDHDCQLIWASYLEPNGVAALLTSQLTGVPYAVRHAGSDIVTLAQIRARRPIYLEVLRRASILSTNRFLAAAFRNEGVANEILHFTPPSVFASGQFGPEGPALDVEAIVREAEAAPFPGPGRCGLGRFDPELPTIGIYGKVSDCKGMHELSAALGQLAQAGRRFNFLTMVGSHGAQVDALRARIEAEGIAERTTMLPFLPHWLVPRFIRRCTLGCYLENRFPIEIHTPQVGWEILACATPLVLCAEVALKAQIMDRIHHGENAFVVDDPLDIPALAEVLDEALATPEHARKVGRRGRELCASFFPAPDVEPLVARIHRVLHGDVHMSLREFQRTLADLYTNPKLREQLVGEEQRALEGRDLSEEELASLLELGRSMAPKVDRFARMLVRKRLFYFLDLCPTTATLLARDESEVRAAFTTDYDFRWRSATEDIEYFAAWLRRLHAEADEGSVFAHPALDDALRFDRAFWRGETELAQSEDRFADLASLSLPSEASDELDHERPLQLAPGVKLECFAYPVHRLLTGAPPDELEARETHVAFTPRAGIRPAQSHAIGPELLTMLRAMSEPCTPADLLAEVRRHHPERDAQALEAAASRAIGRLLQAGLVVLAPESSTARPRGARLAELTWLEAEQRLGPETIVAIPLGAAAKEHGPHLRLDNDLTLANYFGDRVVSEADVVLLPTIPFHYYPAFAEYPGSTTLTVETARDLVVDIVRSIARHGPRRFYVINTGVSTNRALMPAATLLAEQDGVLLHFTKLLEVAGPVEDEIREQPRGTHADEIETSMMLYIAPDRVDMSKAVADCQPRGERGYLSRDPDTGETYSKTGIWGDPTLAARAKGERMVEAIVAGMLADIEVLRAAQLP